MSSEHAVGNEPAAEEQVVEQVTDGFEVVDEVGERERNMRPTFELDIQGKVDTNHSDTGRSGLTLASEERLKTREWEIERTRVRGIGGRTRIGRNGVDGRSIGLVGRSEANSRSEQRAWIRGSILSEGDPREA